MSEIAEKDYGIKPKIIELKSCKDAQNSPCAFGTFCIVYNGEIVAETPISNKRFTNIMNKELKKV
ncbi:MAG: YoaP domain-containing protein [Candidatus Jordarchaeum sp.]|uniref:YoaP domain-containing protein n=1 Tax=Candidatus Jordarchaeum sp. TaxID=2823881 RepID=UPI00404B1A23